HGDDRLRSVGHGAAHAHRQRADGEAVARALAPNRSIVCSSEVSGGQLIPSGWRASLVVEHRFECKVGGCGTRSRVSRRGWRGACAVSGYSSVVGPGNDETAPPVRGAPSSKRCRSPLWIQTLWIRAVWVRTVACWAGNQLMCTPCSASHGSGSIFSPPSDVQTSKCRCGPVD